MLRAVLFDFNGVLVDDEPIHLELIQRVLSDRAVEAEALSDLAGLDDRAAFRRVLERAGHQVDEASIIKLVAEKARLYQEIVRRKGFQFFPGALEVVESAASQGLMLGVVSGALREEIVQALHQSGLRPHFKVIVTAEDVRSGKPDPEIYQRALELFNVEPPLPERLLHPHEVLAIEDSPAGVEAATRAGLVTLGVAQTYSESRLAEASVVVDTLSALEPGRLQSIFSEASGR